MLSHLLVCIPFLFPLQGDRAETKSGEILKGKVVTMKGGKLEFESSSAGKVTIPFGELKSLSTEKEIEVLLKDGTKRKYRFTEGANALSFDSIDAINHVEPNPLTGAVSLGLTRSRGNTERLSFALQGRTVYEMKNTRYTSYFEWLYAEDQEPVTNESFISQRRVSWDNQVDYSFTEHLYTYGRGTALGDKVSEIDYRYTLGAGLGYSVLKTDDHIVNFELGGSERWERKTNVESGKTFNIRLASNGDHNILKDSKAVWDIEYLPSVEDTGVYLINFNVGFAFKIWGDLLSTLTYSVNYDNTPAPGKKRTDQRIIWGLGISF